ncbi:30S ribosomal protein S4 [Alphaproteobacteria bacterium]|nr:30S ribosomal protein S4 [Alphaproteobacteria bacterium]
MTKRLESKYKSNRRFGADLWGRGKSPVNKGRHYGPGQHGQRRGKPSDYGIQLAAKQKLKFYYGNVSERQLRKYFAEADRRRGDTSENLIGLLECRLDAVVYRAKFAPTVFAARQLVSHGHVRVNGKRCNIPSALVGVSDVIDIKEGSRGMAAITSSLESGERNVPDYVQVDDKAFTAKLLSIPTLSEVPYGAQMEPNLVVEFYSR